MTDIKEVLAAYDFAETITLSLGAGKISVTLAEAHATRNPDFALATMMAMKAHDTDNPLKLPIEDKVRILCHTLLKHWDVTHEGKPLPPKDAVDFLSATRAGKLLFQEMERACWNSAKFFNGDPDEEDGEESEGDQGDGEDVAPEVDCKESKKKNSSTSSRKSTRSATRPSPSPGKRKRGGTRSRSASKDT